METKLINQSNNLILINNLSSINNKKHSHQKTPYIRRLFDELTG